MILWLACALLVQDNPAEKEFRTLEERIEKAATVKLKFRSEVRVAREEKERLIETTGTLLLKGETLARMESKSLRDGKENRAMTGLLVCDGKRAKSGSGDIWKEQDAPKDLRPSLNYFVARGGMIMSLMMARKSDRGPDEVRPLIPDLRKLSELSDFKKGEGEGGTTTLSYKIKPTFDQVEIDCTLHLDAAGTKLLKRVYRFKAQKEEAVITETYEEFSLGAEIPDAAFALPAEK